MKIGELIAELSQWPMDADVSVTGEITPPGWSNVATVTSVSGYAGGHISGNDSGVSINVRELPANSDSERPVIADLEELRQHIDFGTGHDMSPVHMRAWIETACELFQAIGLAASDAKGAAK